MGRDARIVRVIWVNREAIYFDAQDWTGFCNREVICPSGNGTRARKNASEGWIYREAGIRCAR
jgi:hypothetical protein